MNIAKKTIRHLQWNVDDQVLLGGGDEELPIIGNSRVAPAQIVPDENGRGDEPSLKGLVHFFFQPEDVSKMAEGHPITPREMRIRI